MNYSEMSDFEINKAVAAACLGEWYDNGTCVIKCDDDDRSIFQPCNSWADAGPIIAENKITILTDETTDEWSATVVQDFCDKRAFKYSNCAGNPLRAAMVTFLMTKEAKNA